MGRLTGEAFNATVKRAKDGEFSGSNGGLSNMAKRATGTSSDKGRRIVGAERATLAKDLVKRYTSGESLRNLAASTDRSYGFVHRMLTESGVQLRGRGGARRRR